MTNPPKTTHAMIALPRLLARRETQSVPLGTSKLSNAVQRARLSDRFAAGRFARATSSFVSQKEGTLILPHSSKHTQIGSVMTRVVLGGLV
ncbi:hypothetical protein AAW01_02710 [Aurantiacibacter gangjinensis]|uniref:Uncharacterized protein n=1 Tax=Aurantiacibacter gangjinensis TaxID=502682 RepID=A0A0G9MQD0_9SPHN|nr:hypothetical protein AAW01_02710 [Aurantiacibacter gangjinensis]